MNRARREMPRSLSDLIGGAVLYALAGVALLALVGPPLVVIAISFYRKALHQLPAGGLHARLVSRDPRP